MKLYVFLCCTALIVTSCSDDQQELPPVDDPSATYVVTVSGDKRSIHVDVSFSIDEPVIFMYVQGTKELPDGEASFIKNLEMKQSPGSVVPLKNLGAGDWKHGAERNTRVTLSYDIELNHEKFPWPSGIDEVLFTRDDGIFFTGDALFILPGTGLKNIAVTMNVPAGWKISVPWKQKEGNTFVADSYRDLIINCGFIGTHHTETISVDDFSLRLAVGGTQKKSVPLFINTMTPAVRAYTRQFGGSKFTDYLIVIHDDVMSDGGAFRSSFSQVIDGEANANSVVTWGHTMLHEIFHLWNGNAIIPSTQEEWFKEGVTDYMTVKYLYTLKIFNETNFLKAMENTYRKYVLARMMERMTQTPAVSIRDAGNDKAKNRLLVYGGGALIAMMLDVELRERTNGAAGLEELLTTMYREFGVTDKRYTMEDVIRIAGGIAGADMRWFFDKYVLTAEQLDVRPYYKKMGLQLDTFVEEIYLSRVPAPSADQKMIFNTLFSSVGSR